MKLIEGMTVEFDPAKYHDTYSEDVKKLIDAKAKGQKRQAPPPQPARSNVIDRVAISHGDGSFALTTNVTNLEFATPVTSPPLPVPRPGSRGRLSPRSRPHLFLGKSNRAPSNA